MLGTHPLFQNSVTTTLAADNQQNEDDLFALAYPVQRMAACRSYSLANTKGTIPCGRAACQDVRTESAAAFWLEWINVCAKKCILD